MCRILLMGYFGAGNFGDDALLADWLARRADWLKRNGIAVDLISGGQHPLESFAGTESLYALIDRQIDKREAMRLDAREYSALVAPGGSLLQDTTSLKSLLYYLNLIGRFSRARRQVFLLNQGLGPFHSWLANYITPRHLKRVTLLSVRDHFSRSWANSQRALAERPALLSCDPLLAPRLPMPEPNDEPPYLLVIPRPTGDLPHPGDTTPEHEALAQYVRYLKKLSGLVPIFMPFHAEQDMEFCFAAAEGVPDAEVCEPGIEHHGTSFLRLISGAGLVLSYRLHGLITAAAHGIPAIGVAYDPKVSAFATEIGYPYAFPATLHEDQARDDALRLWRDRAEVSDVVNERRVEMVSHLNRSEARFDELWNDTHE